ncbi:apical endosomal glycoprotein [Trichomycterus rosablanca]|uniref:apical endosomal glycoprotein n=1 Tax=Trichomycterus rosablanca TaxID=2290929 RepID=UPI002F357684
MKRISIQLSVLLSTVHWALVLGSSGCTGPKCDFICDCTDCSDEQNCGYSGRDFVCDFEDAGMCGWMDNSAEGEYKWERRQRADPLPNSGPSSDYTTGTSTGWFMAVTVVNTEAPSTAVLTSPMISQSSPTCRLQLHFFIWDSGHTGLGTSPLWASILTSDGQKAVVWRPEVSSVRAWREATIFLGRIPKQFQIEIHSLRQEGRSGDVAIDQMEFLNCALPVASDTGSCGIGFLKCKRGGCVEKRMVCDGTDDCGDGTDEENCGNYWSCNFEKDLCGWDLRTLSSLRWMRTSQIHISTSEPLKGPGRDHSSNLATGNFLYVTKPAVFKNDWASFHSPSLRPTNSTHPCHMVFYTHQFGRVSGGLSVLVAERQIYPVWERGGSLGDLWVKAEIEFVVKSSFQILFVGAIRDQAYGGIAVDDITLSPECQLSNDTVKADFPKPPKKPCTVENKICDFYPDCVNGDDEAKCGDFSYDQGSLGWTDTSTGSQSWKLNRESNATSTDVFLFVSDAAGQQLTEAQTRTPLLGPSGPACTLKFSYSLTGSNNHIGEVSVAVVDSVLGSLPRLWEYSGRTGVNEIESWVNEEVYIGARDHRFQLEFRARAQELESGVRIAVTDVRYVDCHPEYIVSSSDGLSCNFETGLCEWYQDQMDNFDWSVQDGIDHTIGIGKSLVVDMWSTKLRGLSGRLISLRQYTRDEHCLSFHYKLYGPDTGALNVKLLHTDGSEELLWTRSGAHGNMWHEGHCPVPHQLTTFQLVFEAVRSGFDGQVAIDDVVFVKGPCSLPTQCSFEGQQCVYSSSGAALWVYQNWDSARTGPKTDHTLETELGHYMFAHSGKAVLPKGSVMTLTSPVRQGVTHTECVYFWYHMTGHNPGILSVYVRPVNGDRVKLFSNSLNQGHVWRLSMGNLSWHGDWQLQFEVEGQGGEDTYVAIDDISFSTHSCPTPDKVCDLERGLCGWSNTQSHHLDRLDWELSNLLSETHYPTPPSDHTLANENGHFLFLPYTSRDTANHNAWLLSPHLPPTKGTCVYFWVYQPVAHDSKLVVWKLSEGSKTELLSLNEAGQTWRHLKLNITSDNEFQIVFEGLKGTKGVLGLDDFGYTVGVNCVGEETDQSISKSSDNTGAIAASAVVAVLLMVTLAVLVFFYLRIRERSRAQTHSSAGGSDNPGFANELYDPSVMQDRVHLPPIITSHHGSEDAVNQREIS